MANDYGVQSIERALDIIEAVAANKNSAVLTKIAEKVGLHKSTAYRIISTLLKRGYLKKNEDVPKNTIPDIIAHMYLPRTPGR